MIKDEKSKDLTAKLIHNNVYWFLNLKKAGMASRNIVIKKQYTLLWISYAVKSLDFSS